MPSILVCAALKNGSPTAPTLEALGLARRIADRRGETVAAALWGAGVAAAAPGLIAGGADVVYVCEQALPEPPPAAPQLAILRKIAGQAEAGLILFPGGPAALDLAPGLAHRLGAGLITDCTGWESGDGSGWIFHKPVYGGKALARMSVAAPPAVVTLRPRTQAPFPADDGRTGTLVAVEAEAVPWPAQTVLVETIAESRDQVALEDAPAVVSGGRGMGGAESFAQLKALASLLGGAVGASRAAVDAGWSAPSTQVGQTGRIVAPTLYFAVALSGSSQHVAGMGGSKVIVAINRDPDAPIMRIANLGIVDDYRNVLTPLIAKLREVLSR